MHGNKRHSRVWVFFFFMATNVKSFVLFSFSVTFHPSASTQVFRKTFTASSLETEKSAMYGVIPAAASRLEIANVSFRS